MTRTDERPHCRLYVLLARAARVGAVLRRGPTDWVQLIRWNTKTDDFESGQWFHGRIYERRSDLSPDGTKLVYFANKFNRKTVTDREFTYAWTAVSRPPYLTAIALWPKGDCWHGGGLFTDDRTLWLNHPPYQAEPHPDLRPRGLVVEPNPHARGEDQPVYHRRLARDGWTLRQPGRFVIRYGAWTTDRTEIWEKANVRAGATLVMELREISFRKPGGPYHEQFRLVRGDETIPLGPADWADWDQRGRLILAREGALFELSLRRHEIAYREIARFDDHRPEPLEAPDWARS